MSGQVDSVDFTVHDEGTVCVFNPMTAEAHNAMMEIPLEDWQYVGNGFVLNWREAMHMIEALYDEGLTVKAVPTFQGV